MENELKFDIAKPMNYNRELNRLLKVDVVNHPGHYKTKNGLETIDVIESFTDGLNGIEATDTGNIIKYICRWKKKNGVEDLKKIIWYTNHLIKHLTKSEKEIINKGANNHFKCPICGGDITRKVIEMEDRKSLLTDPYNHPTCTECGTKYMINVNEDLSYDFIMQK